jgi:chemotaxis protein CheX
MTRANSTLDATLVNTIVKATTDVLGTMANTTVTYQKASAECDYKALGDISAIIGIFGEQGEGMMALSFPLPLANIIVARILAVKPNTLSSEERADGVGELINMISGQTKTSLSQESGSVYRLTLPTVILGMGHEVASRPKQTPYLVVTFEAEDMTFNLQISFKQYE